jgi:hypothetical protein
LAIRVSKTNKKLAEFGIEIPILEALKNVDLEKPSRPKKEEEPSAGKNGAKKSKKQKQEHKSVEPAEKKKDHPVNPMQAGSQVSIL